MKNLIKNKNKVVSIDAETNGLWGQAFMIAAVLFEDGEEVSSFVGRCPIHEDINPWVAKNVFPQIESVEVTHNSYFELLKDFFDFLAEAKAEATIVHMGHIVESKLLIDAHTMGIISDWDAPYLWYDVCVLFDDSTDEYCYNNNIYIPEFGDGTHNALYDCYTAYLAYHHKVSQQ